MSPMSDDIVEVKTTTTTTGGDPPLNPMMILKGGANNMLLLLSNTGRDKGKSKDNEDGQYYTLNTNEEDVE